MGKTVQRVTLLPHRQIHPPSQETPVSYPSLGAIAGFCFYWLAFALSFWLYGLDATRLLMLYTWPLFLALLLLCVLVGMLFGLLWQRRVVLMLLCCGGSVLFSFWLVFSVISGW
ncbi:hypothetical protein CKQ53_01760 [Lonsdalea britannica]|uniref:DUF3561 family protein n=2 Tax=Lonsdalea britannica TaxID=1082704 RepID=A0AAD0SE98_9GAMM|nr:DUF3561 family protein [Lonsdalea britannica]AXW85825.1 hypothetical protein CKQ53_01760 [Lonsdalea britannica]